MGCFRIVTNQDIQQLREGRVNTGWKSVPSDSRYEEKLVRYPNGKITRMTRLSGQTTNYPHTTEFYNPDGSKKHFDNDPRWDSHHSRSKKSTRYGTHRTGGSILDDLGISTESEGK